jgi:hypothetical protein
MESSVTVPRRRPGAPKGGWKKKPVEIGEPQNLNLAGTPAANADKEITRVESDQANDARVLRPIGNRKMFKIFIHKQANTDSNRNVFIPNHDGGKDWVLKRGEEVVVPEYVVNILKEATTIQLAYDFPEQITRGSQAVVTQYEKIPRFAFEIRGEINV